MLTFSSLLGIVGAVAYVYFFFSLLVSALNEWQARMQNRRGTILQRAMYDLLGSQPNCGSTLAAAFNMHPLVAGLSPAPEYPSYIPSPHAGMVLIDLAFEVTPGQHNAPPTLALRDGLRPQHPFTETEQQVLSAMLAGDRNIRVVQARIEKWFTDSAERVTGIYKRRTANWLLAWSLAVSAVFGLDSIRLVRVLYAAALSGAADTKTNALALPIGWFAAGTPIYSPWTPVGILISTLALSMGAPFWFDVANNWVNLRQSGARPDGKSGITG
jgi:hypothetical protein